MDDTDIPIDIQISKLSDWLISRRHVNKDWAQVARSIRQKVKNAINDMPEHPEIVKLLSGSSINYYNCQKIVEILQETEKDSKNIFGWYTSQRMKDWQEIVNMYSKHNVYLAEQGHQLLRNVVYEIPSLKKQIARCTQTQEQCERRLDEYEKTITSINERYLTACQQMGIAGSDVKRELVALACNMDETYDDISRQTKLIKDAVQFYEDFRNFLIPTSSIEILPLIKLITDKGNVSVYEWYHKEAPLSIEKAEPVSLQDCLEKEDTDFTSEEIDFGDDIDYDNQESQIDWGGLETEDDSGQIEWDITGVSDEEKVEIVVESSGTEGGVAKGNEALSLLSYSTTRINFIHELLELQGFLKQRLVELECSETLLSMTQNTSAPDNVQHQSPDAIAVYISQIQIIMDTLTSTKMQHMHLINTSPRYVQRFADSITGRMNEIDGLRKKKGEIQTARQESYQLQSQLNDQLQDVEEKTLVLQRDVQREISLLYGQRQVNLMGKVKH